MEISFSKDEIIAVLAIQKNGWYIGCEINRKESGFFPINFCTKVVSEISDLDEIDKLDSPKTQVAELKVHLNEQNKAIENEKDSRNELQEFTLSRLDQVISLLSNT